jgi:hypothetical protein
VVETSTRFSARRVVARTLYVWSRTLPQLLVVAAIVHVPLLAFAFWLRDVPIEKSPLGALRRLLPYIELTVFSRIVEALATRLVFERLRGAATDVARSIAQGFRRLWTVVTIAGLTAVTFMALPMAAMLLFVRIFGPSDASAYETGFIGIVSFLVVGLACLLVFVVPIPAALVEGLGAFRAFNRSRILTRGSRWGIFWTWFLFGIVVWITNRIVRGFQSSLDDKLAVLLVALGFDLLLASLTCVLPIVLYHDLRETKEGIGIEEILKVFE